MGWPGKRFDVTSLDSSVGQYRNITTCSVYSMPAVGVSLDNISSVFRVQTSENRCLLIAMTQPCGLSP